LFLTESITSTVSPTVASSGLRVPREARDADTVRSGFWLFVSVVASAVETPERVNTVTVPIITKVLEIMVHLQCCVLLKQEGRWSSPAAFRIQPTRVITDWTVASHPPAPLAGRCVTAGCPDFRGDRPGCLDDPRSPVGPETCQA